MITKSEVVDWKMHPVTIRLLDLIKEKINGTNEELIGTALSGDVAGSALRAGAIQAMRDILDLDF